MDLHYSHIAKFLHTNNDNIPAEKIKLASKNQCTELSNHEFNIAKFLFEKYNTINDEHCLLAVKKARIDYPCFFFLPLGTPKPSFFLLMSQALKI